MNYNKDKDIFLKFYKDAKELCDIQEYNLAILFKDKYKVITSLKRQGYSHLVEPFKVFCKNHRICGNCGKLYEGKVNYKCPRKECTDYVEQKSIEINEKRKQTNIVKYGVTNISKLQSVKEKKEKSFMEHYGVSNSFKSEEVKSKIKQTNLERYGAENPAHSPELKQKRDGTNLKKYGTTLLFSSKEIIEKTKNTLKEKYGVDNPLKSNVIREKIKQTNLKRYGCVNPTQNPDIQEKIKQTNIKKYGVERASQSDAVKTKTKSKNKEKYGVPYITQAHISNFKDYETPEVWENFKSVQEACDYFNISFTCAIHNLRKYNPKVIKKRSITQNLIFEALKVENKIANAKTIIPPKELDIHLPDFKLAIEYDGLLYHSQGVSKHSMLNTPNFDKNYHLQKTLECKSRGIQLLHIFEGENIDLWLSMINAKLGLNSRIYARNCYAVELRNSDLRDFLNENHLQGFCNASIAIGLYLRNTKNSTKVQDIETSKLVAVMTFSKPRFSKGYDYELVRYCSLKGYNIIGGASKLWKFFLKKYAPKSVISYANLRFSNGKLYENLGFSLKHRSEPNYYYFKDDMILHSRNKFQKHKLKDLLEIYDPDKSEVENMFANGYRRIFDCGNLVYEWFANSQSA